MHLQEMFACLAFVLVHLCVFSCIFMYRFVISMKNIDLDSEFVSVGFVDTSFISKNSEQRNSLQEEEATPSSTPAESALGGWTHFERGHRETHSKRRRRGGGGFSELAMR